MLSLGEICHRETGQLLGTYLRGPMTNLSEVVSDPINSNEFVACD